MLIYNFQKEFLGIDEKDLRTLGFKNLQGLRAEVTDFSDLFVKTPGYIHNFKHVHWIDFITCAESNEESKVIINVNNKNYTASLHITTAFLVDHPSSKAFLVNLNNLRELTTKESERISNDIVQREAPIPSKESKKIVNTTDSYQEPEVIHNIMTTQDVYEEENFDTLLTEDPYEAPLEIHMDDAPLEVKDFENEIITIAHEDAYDDAPLEIDIDNDFDDLLEEEDLAPQHNKHVEIIQESFDNGYVYNPSVASEELGLPLDLIEEFIQDFIEQSKEFKEDLYKHLNENDLDNLKILSHKLKGVAANLRIEDALETITIVNTESNINIISENLDTFYKIIAKLAGETINVEKEVEADEVTLEKEEESLYINPMNVEEQALEPESPKKEEEELEIDIEEPVPLPKFTEEEENKSEEIQIDSDMQKDFTLKIEKEKLEVENTPITTIDYSKKQAADEIGLDIKSFQELFKDYIQEMTELFSSIKKSIETSETQKIISDTLKLKGMSDNMRVKDFTDEIEILFTSKKSEELQNAIENIEQKIEQLSSREV